jgi:DNA-binding CsgD family transcriptional regulator
VKPNFESQILRQRVQWDPLVLNLHKAVDADTFWKYLQELLGAIFPHQSIIAALRATGDSPPVFYHSHHRSHHTSAWFTETLMIHPCYAYLMAHPGRPVLRLSEVLTPEVIDDHPFHRQVMVKEGWRHGLAFVFWKDGMIRALIPVNRSAEMEDFSDEDVAMAEWLHPQIEVALHRILDLCALVEDFSSLTSYVKDLPLPTLRLSWDLKLVYCNRAAREMLHEWTSGRDSGQKPPGSVRAKVPAALRLACAALKDKILAGDQPDWPPVKLPPPIRVDHPEGFPLTASIRPLLPGGGVLDNPCFWIHLEKQDSVSSAELNLSALKLLTPAERKVAELVVMGLTNEEIGEKIHRSLSTVKAHLHSAFAKLGVSNRASLIARLRVK